MAGKSGGQLAMAVAGAVVGSFFGGIYGFYALGISGGFLAGGILGAQIFPSKNEQGNMPQMSNYPVQRSNKGTPRPIIYGADRLAGNVIWMGELQTIVTSSSGGGGGKGGGGGGSEVDTITYKRSFLLSLCEGSKDVTRCWKGKEEIAVSSFTQFSGDDNEGIADLIDETLGADYKTDCCVYFDNFDLGSGQALPNFVFEVRDATVLSAISTVEDLQAMNDDLDGDYEILCDIVGEGESFTRVGTDATPFTGSLEGNNHTVSNLSITSDKSMSGLFGKISGATIQNVKLEDITLTASDDCESFGLLVGYADTSTITNCFADGDIVSGANTLAYVGGCIGSSEDSTISKCGSDVTITVENASYHGLFIGGAGADTTITDCYAWGTMTSTIGTSDETSGGFVGSVDASVVITRCYAKGIIQGQSDNQVLTMGGFAGEPVEESAESAVFADCFWLNTMNDKAYAGEDEQQRINYVSS